MKKLLGLTLLALGLSFTTYAEMSCDCGKKTECNCEKCDCEDCDCKKCQKD